MAFALLADHASVPPDGKLYVLGGGISNINMAQLPGRVSFAAVGGFRFTRADFNATHTVELRLVDADGGLVIPPATIQFQTAQAIPADQEEITVSAVSYLSPMFGEPGRYRVEYWGSGRLLAGVGLTVSQSPNATPPTGPPPRA